MSVIGNYTAGSNGPILPRIKYNAVKGRFYRMDRAQVPGVDGWQTTETPLTLPIAVAFDFARMEIGPVGFPGNKPDFHLVKLADVEASPPTAVIPPLPSTEHKIALRVMVYNKELGVRDFMNQAKTVLTALDSLYESVKATPQYQAGKVPVVNITGTKEVKFKTPDGGSGSSEEPVWAFDPNKWIDRKVFDDASQPAQGSLAMGGAPASPAPAATQTRAAPPPAPADFELNNDVEF